jgi:hypothetical protein
MRIPVIKGTSKRRLLVNFRADPNVVQRLLPQPFRPKIHLGRSLVGICLIRVEQIRPSGLPGILGVSSENAAHRIAVEWKGLMAFTEGVFIPRRDTGALLNRLAVGGCLQVRSCSPVTEIYALGRIRVEDDGSGTTAPAHR